MTPRAKNFKPSSLSAAPRRWDIVLTCFEPLTKVTGGIGTYHKLLMKELDDNGMSVLVLTRECNTDVSIGTVEFVFVEDYTPEGPYNFVGSEHEYFSLHCHFAFKSLWDDGHRFGFVEFSDYGSDGFYPMRARASGVYDFETAAVRLHSPRAMLVEDNGSTYSAQSVYVKDQIDREMCAYEDCDVILYGGDAMRDRILDVTNRLGLDVGHKFQKCPHPYPKHLFQIDLDQKKHLSDTDILVEKIQAINKHVDVSELKDAEFVGIFGRIEDRKGQYQLIDGLIGNGSFVKYMNDSNVHFLIAGHNVLDDIGNYKLGDLYQKIHNAGLSSRFHFTGRVDQDTLAPTFPK